MVLSPNGSMWHLSDWPEGLLVLRQEHWFQPRVHAPGCPVRHWMVFQRNLSDMMSQRIHWWHLWQIWWSKTKCPEKSRRSRASGARFQCSLGWALLPAEWLSGDIGNSAQGLTESGHFDRSSTADYRWSASSGTSQLCSNMRRSRGHRDPMTGPENLIDSCWSMLVVIPFDSFPLFDCWDWVPGWQKFKGAVWNSLGELQELWFFGVRQRSTQVVERERERVMSMWSLCCIWVIIISDGGALPDTWITATYSVHCKTEQEWSPSIRVAKYLHNMCSASKLLDNLDRAINTTCVIIIEGSLEVKLPTIWTDEKQIREEAEGRERLEERRVEEKESEERRCRCAKRYFPMICGSGGSKSRLAKAAGAEPCGQMRDEKLHAVVARSTFPSQNVQNTSGPDHFWRLRCRKSARRCGAKHISKSKCTKHLSVGPLLEVEMSKKCTPLWREAHFEVKMYKTHHSRTTFESRNV